MLANKINKPNRQTWYLYVLACKGNKLYTGITVNLAQRYAQHLAGKGAAFTRSNPPLNLLAASYYPCRSTATKAEIAFKKLRKVKKIEQLTTWPLQQEELASLLIAANKKN